MNRKEINRMRVLAGLPVQLNEGFNAGALFGGDDEDPQGGFTGPGDYDLEFGYKVDAENPGEDTIDIETEEEFDLWFDNDGYRDQGYKEWEDIPDEDDLDEAAGRNDNFFKMGGLDPKDPGELEEFILGHVWQGSTAEEISPLCGILPSAIEAFVNAVKGKKHSAVPGWVNGPGLKESQTLREGKYLLGGLSVSNPGKMEAQIQKLAKQGLEAEDISPLVGLTPNAVSAYLDAVGISGGTIEEISKGTAQQYKSAAKHDLDKTARRIDYIDAKYGNVGRGKTSAMSSKDAEKSQSEWSRLNKRATGLRNADKRTNGGDL